MNPPHLICHRAEVVFGQEESWGNVQRVPLRENVAGGLPQQATALRCAWSGPSLHVLFDCVDREPWATITQRDGPLWEEEVVEVFLDSVGDQESYFEFEVNPLNTVLDLVLRRNRSGYRKDFGWDCDGLRTNVERTPAGWTAEFLIPFAAVTPEPPRAGTQWRVNFYRIDRPKGRNRELSAWSPTTCPNFHIPERFGILKFR